MNDQVRGPNGHFRSRAPQRAQNVDTAVDTSVVANIDAAIIADTTTANLAVELPPARSGGRVLVANAAGANACNVTPAPNGTDSIVGAGTVVTNPTALAVGAGEVCEFVAVQVTSSVFAWISVQGALLS